MRFALVGPAHPFRGGIAQYNSALFRALSVEHEALLITFRRQYPAFLFPGKTQTDSSREPFIVPGEGILDSLRPSSWSAVARRILEYAPDAIVFQWWQPFFGLAYSSICRAVKAQSQIPVIFLCHNILSHGEVQFFGREAIERLLVQRSFNHADGFLVHAEGLVRLLKEFRPASPVRKIFLPLFEFYQRWDDVPASESEIPRLLFFGKIRPYKGLETFLEALALLRGRMPFEATIAGEFYVDPRPFKRLVHKNGLVDQVTWIDRYISNEEVPHVFRSADVVVLPYVEATQSGVVSAAYQFDVPVIASDVGGLSEIVIEGETGCLFPPGNAEALAEKIIQYFEARKKKEFQENIREFRQRMSWNQAIDNLIDLVSEVRGRGVDV